MNEVEIRGPNGRVVLDVRALNRMSDAEIAKLVNAVAAPVVGITAPQIHTLSPDHIPSQTHTDMDSFKAFAGRYRDVECAIGLGCKSATNGRTG